MLPAGLLLRRGLCLGSRLSRLGFKPIIKLGTPHTRALVPVRQASLFSTTTEPVKNTSFKLEDKHQTNKNEQDEDNGEEASRINKGRRRVAYWLLGCCGLVSGIVMVGGITRLTQSGLSITQWKPLSGIIPPITQKEWEEEFERYKAFPEYHRLNAGMTLSEFKRIFFWEFSHRLLGRAIGVAFFFPFVYFISRGYINRPLGFKLAGIFGLGGMQGALGWYMVKSGLDARNIDAREGIPRVSQYRLAAHLGSAFTIYAAMLWIAMDLLHPKGKSLVGSAVSSGELPARALSGMRVLRKGAPVVAGMVFITALSGAFVAGLDAGLIYNEFPLMGGSIVPEDLINPQLKPLIRNAFEHDVAVQFEHRVLATSTFCAITAMFLLARRRAVWPHLPRSSKRAANALMGMAGVQVTLGISTLLTFVPTPLAASHQAGSLTLLTIAMWFLHLIRRLPK